MTLPLQKRLLAELRDCSRGNMKLTYYRIEMAWSRMSLTGVYSAFIPNSLMSGHHFLHGIAAEGHVPRANGEATFHVLASAAQAAHRDCGRRGGFTDAPLDLRRCLCLDVGLDGWIGCEGDKGSGTVHGCSPWMGSGAAAEGRRPSLSQALGSRKSGACIDPHGFDAGKLIKGKKRYILVDTLGLLLHAIVHSAGIQDRDGAILLLATSP
jgi:hypothetical protein